jgi:hypothetical protein
VADKKELLQQIWVLIQDIAVFFQDGRADSPFQQARANQLQNGRRRVFRIGKCGEFDNTGVKDNVSRYGLARFKARSRRLASTSSITSCSVIVFPRLACCARANAGKSL